MSESTDTRTRCDFKAVSLEKKRPKSLLNIVRGWGASAILFYLWISVAGRRRGGNEFDIHLADVGLLCERAETRRKFLPFINVERLDSLSALLFMGNFVAV
ncbi:hypothetical protein CEXT_20751 [Caerostris extrusa]|uniref:Uncharacterized protein n=1 Tax=Caerostris extrusa TaxID=172846 RepID=A0AAV4QUX2_CAEEX|nr:hypothetical protein CEXT_20751 [Caerostris extrusa]